jgi:hypothetical protein
MRKTPDIAAIPFTNVMWPSWEGLSLAGWLPQSIFSEGGVR